MSIGVGRMLEAAEMAYEGRRLQERFTVLVARYGSKEAHVVWAEAHVLLASGDARDVDEAVARVVVRRRSPAADHIDWIAVTEWGRG